MFMKETEVQNEFRDENSNLIESAACDYLQTETEEHKEKRCRLYVTVYNLIGFA